MHAVVTDTPGKTSTVPFDDSQVAFASSASLFDKPENSVGVVVDVLSILLVTLQVHV